MLRCVRGEGVRVSKTAKLALRNERRVPTCGVYSRVAFTCDLAVKRGDTIYT